MAMPNPQAQARLAHALAAIDVMTRSGKGGGGRLVEMAREARKAAEGLALADRAGRVAAESVETAGQV